VRGAANPIGFYTAGVDREAFCSTTDQLRKEAQRSHREGKTRCDESNAKLHARQDIRSFEYQSMLYDV
jgi:hypothetical protein